MTLTTTRNPRGGIVLRTNECTNPRFGSMTSWTGTGFGTGGAGADTYNSTTGELKKNWTTATSNADGAGFSYRHTGFSAGVTKAMSADVFPNGFAPSVAIYCNHWNASNVFLTTTKCTSVQLLNNNQWQRISGVVTAPAGTAYTDVMVVIAPGNNPQANQGIAVRHVLIEAGSTVGSYFDGTTYAAGFGTQWTTWDGTADASRSLLNDVDPASLIAPKLVLGWDETSGTRNVFHELLSGAVVLVQRVGQLRAGVLKLFFLTRAEAMNCRAQHRLAGVWTYVDSDNPETGMTYAVSGDIHVYNDANRLRWTVEIPFREVS